MKAWYQNKLNDPQSWVYKQCFYRNSAWNRFQQAIAFAVIPFVISAVIASGVSIAVVMPVAHLLQS